MSKRPLILFSGGLDSTHLLWTNPEADTLSVKLASSFSKVKWEEEAREKIIRKIINEKREKDENFLRGRNHVAEYAFQALASSDNLTQMAVWFNMMFEYADASRHSSVLIGYTSGDCALQDLNSLKSAWDNLWKAARPRSYAERPQLEFPLAGWNKVEQLRVMPDDLIRLTWSCEAPYNNTGAECGRCTPCRTKFTNLLLAKKTHLSPWSLTYNFVIENIGRDLLRDMLYARRTVDGKDTIYEHEIPDWDIRQEPEGETENKS